MSQERPGHGERPTGSRPARHRAAARAPAPALPRRLPLPVPTTAASGPPAVVGTATEQARNVTSPSCDNKVFPRFRMT